MLCLEDSISEPSSPAPTLAFFCSAPWALASWGWYRRLTLGWAVKSLIHGSRRPPHKETSPTKVGGSTNWSINVTSKQNSNSMFPSKTYHFLSYELFYLITLFCVCGCFLVCVSVHHMSTIPSDAEEGIRSPGTGITSSCELPSGCWEPNKVVRKSSWCS